MHVGGIGSLPSQIDRSEWQTPLADHFTCTSPGWEGASRVSSSTVIGSWFAVKRQAFMGALDTERSLQRKPRIPGPRRPLGRTRTREYAAPRKTAVTGPTS